MGLFDFFISKASKYDIRGYDQEGFDRQGYNFDGYNRDGYDRNGFNKQGIVRPWGRFQWDSEDCVLEKIPIILYGKDCNCKKGTLNL